LLTLGVPSARETSVVPKTARELKALAVRAEYDYIEQAYPEAKAHFACVSEAIESGGFDAILGAELQFRALTRRADIALHDSRLTDAVRLEEQARAWLARHPEVPEPLRVGFALGRVDRLIDGLDTDGAAAEFERVGLDLDAGTRAASEDSRRLAARFLGTWRRLDLLRGNPEAALAHQRRLRQVLPLSSEQPRVLCDLGFVLARAGHEEEALEVLDEGIAEVGAVPIPTYRLQTEAFLRYFRGRLRVCRGSRLDDADRLRELRQLMVNPAPRWRLDQVLALDALAAGECAVDAGLAALVAARPDERKSFVFSRMIGVIALLLAHRARPDLTDEIGGALQRTLDGLVGTVPWPPLAGALKGLREHDGLDAGSARFILAHRAY
jgi:hypothetical protein